MDPNVLPPYDFSEVQSLTPLERLEQSVKILQGSAQVEAKVRGEVPAPFQPGFSETKIADLEKVQTAVFAPDVKEFLRHWRRIEGIEGLSFYGPDCWLADESTRGFGDKSYLVIGDYWRYADGDLLIMPTSGETDKVFLFLHEDGPKIEELAPSFSLALWRTAHEDRDEDFGEDDE